ncbi:MAG: DUF4112 domain-containing protein [Patescibacteria group bacterium]|jgi:hypothetical protein
MNSHLKTATSIARLLDASFKIGEIEIGLDPILGLIPGGDLITFTFSLYLIFIALRLKLPREKLLLMTGNIAFDLLLGAIPIIGDIADIFFRSNTRNLKILQEHSESYPTLTGL